MAISRMQQPRQQYGLGRLVKKAFKGLKKVVKSPLGKAALLGGGLWGLNKFGLGSGKMGQNFLSRLGIGKYLNPFNKANPLLYTGGQLSKKKMFGLGAAGLIAAPFIQKALGYGPYEEVEEEVEDWTQTPQSILDIRQMARAQDPSLAFLPASAYTQSGWYGADGGVVGLANGGNPGEAQMEQMLRAEYMKYRNKGGTMPYEQFKILVMKQAQQGQMPNQMMAADGGRAGYRWGSGVINTQPLETYDVDEFEDIKQSLNVSPMASGTTMESPEELYRKAIRDGTFEGTFEEFLEYLDHLRNKFSAVQEEDIQFAAQGGRAGYQGGELVEQQTDLIEGPQGGEEFQETVVEGPEQPSREQLEALAMEIFQLPLEELDDEQLVVVYQEAMQGQPMEEAVQEDVQFAANGGRMGFQMGGDDDEDITYNPYRAMDMYKRTRRQEGGLMDLGGQEKDYRDEGGFVALGGEERADDVPARLSKNEFVFTADAVRNAGGGDIDRGSEVMQNMMDNLEAGGEISEESQGLEGGEEIMSEEIIDESNPAQGMFENYEQLQSRVA